MPDNEWIDWPPHLDLVRTEIEMAAARVFNQLHPKPPSDALGGESNKSLNGVVSMPAQSISSQISTPAPAVPLNGYYPKFLQGASGSVWLVTAPKTGVIIHLSNRPQKAKHKLGYYTTRLDEGKMSVFKGNISLVAA